MKETALQGFLFFGCQDQCLYRASSLYVVPASYKSVAREPPLM